MPGDSYVQFVIKDFDIDFEFDLEIDDNGYLNPVVYFASIDFGDSYFHHDNFWAQIFFHQLVELSMVMIENTSYFLGDRMFSEMLGPVLDSYANNYTHDFKI